MLKKILSIFLIIAILLGVSACNELKKSAVFYDDVKEWIKEDYLHNNMTKGSDWENEAENESLPETITKIIENKEQFDEAFNEFPIEVDFEKEMVIVYLFFTVDHTKLFSLKNLKLKDNVLHIEFERETKIGDKDAGLPWQRCFAIKMNKVEFEEIDIQISYKEI